MDGAPAKGIFKPRLIFIMSVLICIAAVNAMHIRTGASHLKFLLLGGADTVTIGAIPPDCGARTADRGLLKAGPLGLSSVARILFELVG